MRPLFLPQSAQEKTRKKAWRFWSGLSVIALGLSWGIASFATLKNDTNSDPMEDKYSKAIRAEYAKCRTENNPMAQFFCTCRILEKQCDAPRRLEHGDWNTVEYWPSDDKLEREVQFILFADYDILGDFAPINKGIVVTCFAGFSDFNVFIGENVNPDKIPDVMIDSQLHQASFENQDGSWILGFKKSDQAYRALRDSKEMSIIFTDMENDEKTLEFDTFGFDNVSKGWEKLCMDPSS